MLQLWKPIHWAFTKITTWKKDKSSLIYFSHQLRIHYLYRCSVIIKCWKVFSPLHIVSLLVAFYNELLPSPELHISDPQIFWKYWKSCGHVGGGRTGHSWMRALSPPQSYQAYVYCWATCAYSLGWYPCPCLWKSGAHIDILCLIFNWYSFCLWPDKKLHSLITTCALFF